MIEFILNLVYHVVVVALGIVVGLQANGWLIHLAMGH